MIYFMEVQSEDKIGGHRPIKIGYTRNIASLKNRICELQIGNHLPIVLVGLIRNGTKAQEFQLHDALSDHHIRGEWFEASPALKRLIARHPPPSSL